MPAVLCPANLSSDTASDPGRRDLLRARRRFCGSECCSSNSNAPDTSQKGLIGIQSHHSRGKMLLLLLLVVVIYRRYIAQCRLKSVGFTTSRKINSLRVSRNLSVESQRDTSTRPAIGCLQGKKWRKKLVKNRQRPVPLVCSPTAPC